MPLRDFEAGLGRLETCLGTKVESGCGSAYLNFTTAWENSKADQDLYSKSGLSH